MGNRYYITGVQLGMLYAMTDAQLNEQVKKSLKEVEDNQWIGTSENIGNRK